MFRVKYSQKIMCQELNEQMSAHFLIVGVSLSASKQKHETQAKHSITIQ